MVCVLQGMVCSVPELKYVVITSYGVQHSIYYILYCIIVGRIGYKTTYMYFMYIRFISINSI